MNQADTLEPQLNRIQVSALIIGVVALGLCIVGGFISTQQFFRSYLFAYLFWFGIALGSLAWMALQHLVRGGWGFVIQRPLEFSARTLPLMLILFIPILFGIKELYTWANPTVVASDQLLQHKKLYLNTPFFIIRALVYFGLWIFFAYLVSNWSLRQDRTGEPGLTRKIKLVSAPLLGVYVLTLTFASIDWGMSLNPHWFSTMYGILFLVGQGLSSLAFVVIAIRWLSRYKPLSEVVTAQHYHDLGNLMLTFVVLWAYTAFSQMLIVWAGNLPEEITWYLDRWEGGWQWLGVVLALFHFAVPFIVLLSRRAKRRAEILVKVALAMLFMRLVDLYWLIAPSLHPGEFSIHWMDVVAPIGIGGIWVAFFIWQLKGRALLPTNDPRLAEVLQHD